MFSVKNVIILIVCYLIGSITTGDLVARFKKVNLRQSGSGNVGATNVYRTMGKFYALVVFLGDLLKGVVAVWLGRRLMSGFSGFDPGLLTGTLAIIGHNWPIFSGFRGGKGMATSAGVVIVLIPLSLTVVFPVWIITFLTFGYVSLASIISAAVFPIGVYFLSSVSPDPYIRLFAVLVAVLAIYRHKTNIQRLFKGEEHRILYQKRGAHKS